MILWNPGRKAESTETFDLEKKLILPKLIQKFRETAINTLRFLKHKFSKLLLSFIWKDKYQRINSQDTFGGEKNDALALSHIKIYHKGSYQNFIDARIRKLHKWTSVQFRNKSMYYVTLASDKLAFNRKTSVCNSLGRLYNLLSKSGQFESERKDQWDAGMTTKH